MSTVASPPGAHKSTVALKFEYGAFTELMSIADTEITFGYAAGKNAVPELALPAAAKTVTPAATAELIADCSVAFEPGPPRLMLITSARCAGSVVDAFARRAA